MGRGARQANWGAPFGPLLYQSTVSDELHQLMLTESLALQKNKENDYRDNLAGNIEEEYSFSDTIREQCADEILFLCANYAEKLGEKGLLLEQVFLYTLKRFQQYGVPIFFATTATSVTFDVSL